MHCTVPVRFSLLNNSSVRLTPLPPQSGDQGDRSVRARKKKNSEKSRDFSKLISHKVFNFTVACVGGLRMDLETENRIASVLLREAAELRRQAEKDGVRAYLEKPNVRHRPNSRFLTATVLGVQQSNRAVETNEMWKARQKEIELENERLKRKSREESSSRSQMKRSGSFSKRSLDKRCSSSDEKKVTHASSSDKRLYLDDDDEGLGDDEIESFLQSRNKRGRGSIGSRMDETGPYLLAEKVDKLQSSDTGERKVVLGPERPPSLRQHSDDKECCPRKSKDSMKKRSKKDKKTEKKRKRDKH
ncbi:hypothetical protein N665_0367s0055 [Sinapis alba]|nr:hypothetical protein N665_0367s0055 [Sinapis alba]